MPKTGIVTGLGGAGLALAYFVAQEWKVNWPPGTLPALGIVAFGLITFSVQSYVLRRLPSSVFQWGARRKMSSLPLIVLFGAAIGAILAIPAGYLALRSAPLPTIRVAHSLRADSERGLFLLSLWNDGDGDVFPRITLKWLQSDDGQRHENHTPLLLAWAGATPPFSHGDEGKIAVAFIDHQAEVIKFGGTVGVRWVSMYSTKGNRPLGAAFCVRINVPGSTWSAERVFRLEPDPTRELGFRPTLIESR